MNRSLGHWLAVAVVLVVGTSILLANHLTTLNSDLLILGMLIMLAGALYLIFERRFSK